MKPESMAIRQWYGARSRRVIGLFDTGSEDGLIRRSAARGLARAKLPTAVSVIGIGGAVSKAEESAVLLVRALGKWCRYAALVVPDRALDVDLLIGEDFLSRFGLIVDVRKNAVEVAYPEHFRRMTRRAVFVASPRGTPPR